MTQIYLTEINCFYFSFILILFSWFFVKIVNFIVTKFIMLCEKNKIKDFIIENSGNIYFSYNFTHHIISIIKSNHNITLNDIICTFIFEYIKKIMFETIKIYIADEFIVFIIFFSLGQLIFNYFMI